MDRIARMQRIWETIRDIPQGSVASYGQIAEIAGIPRGARQVGYALRQLPDGHDVPWHRVLQVSGKIAFAPGSGAYQEQRKRLMMEDVAVIAGRVGDESTCESTAGNLIWMNCCGSPPRRGMKSEYSQDRSLAARQFSVQ
jgi:methylated-DNA-protein-cysteine methyltransferase-like protein